MLNAKASELNPVKTQRHKGQDQRKRVICS